jgi:hypothetical protein
LASISSTISRLADEQRRTAVARFRLSGSSEEIMASMSSWRR